MVTIPTIEIPRHFVRLAESWHGGQDSMLYAVASTGGLTPGTHRPWHPDESRPMDDAEWLVSLWSRLATELREGAAWMADHPLPDADYDDPAAELAGLRSFLAFAETTVRNIHGS